MPNTNLPNWLIGSLWEKKTLVRRQTFRDISKADGGEENS